MSAALAPPASRNAPCPCGSGKRYKDCHGALGPIAAAPAVALAPTATTADLLLRERARIEWTLGDANAAATCRAALERAPDDVAAWNLLGEILSGTDPAAASEAWWRALDVDPENAEASFHLGNRQREQGEHAAATIHYERALRAAPGHPGVLNNLGLTLEATGQSERAEACYRQALAADPEHAGALANLANLLSTREAIRETVSVYDRLFAVRRDWPAAVWIRRAMAQSRAQDLSGAVESYG